MENQTGKLGTEDLPLDGQPTLVKVPVSQYRTIDDSLLEDTLPRIALTVAAQPAGGSSPQPSVSSRAFRGLIIQSFGKFYGYATIALGLYLRLRTLDYNSYGDYGIVFVYLSFFSVVADGGIMYITIREASKFPDQIEKILSATITLKVFLATIAYGVGIALAFLVMPYSTEVRIAIAIAGVSMALINISGAFDVVYSSRLRFGYPTAANFALNNIIFIGTVALFLYALRLPANAGAQTVLFYLMVGVNVIANLAQSFIYCLGGLRQVKVRLNFDWDYFRSILKVSIPMGIVGVLGQVHGKVDSILLSVLKTASVFAVYNVAYRVIDIVTIFFGVFTNIMFPVLAQASAQGSARYERIIQRILNIAISLSIPLAVGIALLAPEIINLLGGKKYPQAVLPLTILSFSLISSLLGMIFTYIIIVQNRQRNLIWVYAVNICANVGLNLYAIPRYSYNGSAVATIITETLGMLLVIIILNRYQRTLPSFGILLRVLIACAVMAAGILALRRIVPGYTGQLNLALASAMNAIIYGGVGFVLYAATLYILGGVDPAVSERIVARLPFLKQRTG